MEGLYILFTSLFSVISTNANFVSLTTIPLRPTRLTHRLRTTWMSAPWKSALASLLPWLAAVIRLLFSMAGVGVFPVESEADRGTRSRTCHIYSVHSRFKPLNISYFISSLGNLWTPRSLFSRAERGFGFCLRR